MRDDRGCPIRRVNGVRVCARPKCESTEFRIDGYCSSEHREYHGYEHEIARLKVSHASARAELRAEIARLKAEVERLRREWVDREFPRAES